jgi:hypothetical protein
MSFDESRRRRDGLRVYGEWAGNPHGKLEDVNLCVEGVFRGGSIIESQCSRLRGHGKDGLYCKQHATLNEGIGAWKT